MDMFGIEIKRVLAVEELEDLQSVNSRFTINVQRYRESVTCSRCEVCLMYYWVSAIESGQRMPDITRLTSLCLLFIDFAVTERLESNELSVLRLANLVTT